MKLRIRPAEPGDDAAIGRLNERLKAGGWDLPVYGDDPAASVPGAPVRDRLFVAAEGDEIRGAVWLKEQPFWVGDERVDAGWAKYPVAESLIDRRYSGVPAALMLHLLREQPRLLALGMGGVHSPFARLLAGLGWTGSAVPFQFLLVRPARALREIRYGGSGRGWDLLRWLLANTGVGWAGYRLVAGGRALAGGGAGPEARADVVDSFAAWTDEIWQRSRAQYGFVGQRDRALLDRLYPADFPGLTRLRVTRGGEAIGWVCVLRVDLRDGVGHEHFGRLRVGLLADAFAAPEDATAVLRAGVRHLRESGVDLVFSNQAHPAWVAALRSMGFLEGPSNFAFFRAPAVTKLMGNGGSGRHAFVNRGDCDGPRFSQGGSP